MTYPEGKSRVAKLGAIAMLFGAHGRGQAHFLLSSTTTGIGPGAGGKDVLFFGF